MTRLVLTLAAAGLGLGSPTVAPTEPEGEETVPAEVQGGEEQPDGEAPGADEAEPAQGNDDGAGSSDDAGIDEDPAPAADPPDPAPAPARRPPPPMPEYDPDSGLPPGGYWGRGEAPVVAPKEGDEELLSAYILLPLAALTTVSGAASLWLTHPDHCPRRLQSLGYDATAKQCQSLLILNAIRTSYGAIGVVTGFVLLGIGLHRKKQYELWKKRNFRSRLELGPTRAGLHIRF